MVAGRLRQRSWGDASAPISETVALFVTISGRSLRIVSVAVEGEQSRWANERK